MLIDENHGSTERSRGEWGFNNQGDDKRMGAGHSGQCKREEEKKRNTSLEFLWMNEG